MEELLTEKEVAGIYEVLPTTVQQWRYKGIGPAYFKQGGLIRYRRSDVQKHIDSLVVEPEPKAK